MSAAPSSTSVSVSTDSAPDAALVSSLVSSFLSVLSAHSKSGAAAAAVSAIEFIQATKSAVATVLHDKFNSTDEGLINVFNEFIDSSANHSLSSSSSNASAAQKKPVRAYIDGCFDLMHSGHYNAVRQAKALCDVLVVGVHSDAEILKHKGPPVMNEKERMAVVESCKWVDEVVFDTPYDPSLELLDKLNVDFCIHGDDPSTTADGRDAYEETKKAGRMKVIKRTEGISTTDLVGRLLLMTKTHHVKSPTLAPHTSNTSSPAAKSLADAAIPQLALDPPVLAATTSAAAAGILAATSSPTHGPFSKKGADNMAFTNSPPLAARGVDHYAAGISNFLPTTWRIAQFSNNRIPTKDDVIVYIDGAFDLFHVGHIETLKKAKALGTFLYVGIHDDLTVNRHKGKNYPIMNLHERVMCVLSCKYVDEVVIGAPWIVNKDLVKTLNIAIVATGSNTKMDRDLEPHEDPYKQIKDAKKLVEIDSSHSLSTEDVVIRIIENRLKYEKRNEKRSKKEVDYLSNKTFVEEIGSAAKPAK